MEETISAFTFIGLFPSFAQKIEIILNGDVNDRETLQPKLSSARKKQQLQTIYPALVSADCVLVAANTS